MTDPIILIAAAFGGMLGLLLGALIGFFLGRRNKKEPETSIAPVAPAPIPAPPSTPLRNTPKDSVEVLSLWRNERSGKMIAMLETKPLSPSHLTSDQKTKMSQLLTSLHTMIGDVPPSPAPPTSTHMEPSAQISAPITPVPLVQDHSDELAPPAQPMPDSVETGSEAIPSPDQPQKVYFADTLPEPVTIGQALLSNPFKITPPATTQKPASTPKSIVEQIDEIFQAKLVGTPYEAQKIQLKESLNGMTILMGAYKYEGVDAVPDATIRGLIKESAREWNEKVSRKR